MTGNQRGQVMLFVVTEDWAFLSHRVPMARAAQAMGFDVHVACRVGERRAEIEALGFEVHPLRWMRRGAVHPTRDTRLVLELAALVQGLQPTVCNLIAIKPIALGLPAAVLSRTQVVCTFIGMGSMFRGTNSQAGVRRALTSVIRVGVALGQARAVVQNPDDAELVRREFSIPVERTHLVEGSGIDSADIVCHARPEEPVPVRFVFAGRLLRDKGVLELVEAFNKVRETNPDVELILVGDIDITNPSSVTQEEVNAARLYDGIHFAGHSSQAEVMDLLGTCDVAVLPSYGEGLPRFLLEAGASGLALVATDVPGCRSVVVDGDTGILVPAARVEELADAMSRMARDHAFRRDAGLAARRRVLERFDSKVIEIAISAVYAASLSEPRQGLVRRAGSAGRGKASSGSTRRVRAPALDYSSNFKLGREVVGGE